MRAILQLLFFILLAFVCGALLAYPFYQLLNPVISLPFNKLISHITSITGLALIFCFLKYNHILDRNTAGFNFKKDGKKAIFVKGILAGIIIMLILESVLYATGVHIPEPELSISTVFLLSLTFKAIVSGLVVAIIEETLYRGALLGGLLKLSGTVPAIAISSIIYAAVHFLEYPAVNDQVAINLFTGLQILPFAFSDLVNPEILDAFLALTAFGVFLSMLRLYTGNILASVAVHTGVVIAIKFIKEFTDYNYNTTLSILVSSYDHLLGLMSLLWLLLLILILLSQKFLFVKLQR